MKKNWEIKKLGEVVHVLDNLRKPITKRDRKEGDYPYYGATGILSYVNHYIFSEKLVLIGEDGAKWASGDKTSFIAEGKYWVNNHAHVIRPNRKIVLDEWIIYFLNFSDLTPFITGMTVPKLNQEKMRSIPIPLPPLTEQQRIVAKLDEAFAAIDKAKSNAEQNLKNTKELFDVYLHRFYTSKEEGWEAKKLKEVAEYFNGLTYSPKDISNEGIIVLRSSNIQNDELDFRDIVRVNLRVKEKIIVKDGDILMCSRNGSARLVGKTAIIKNLNEEMTFGTFMMIVRSQYNTYLTWFFKSTDFRNQIKGGENTMINQITRYMLDDIVLSFPPIDKQNEIVQKLDALSIEIKKLEAIYNKKIDELEKLKKSIFKKAFTGELTAKDFAI
jgi:type I restriction enzyme S subunit